jgi:cobalamin biosynthesis protein CobT
VIGILLGRARRTGAISCLRAVPYATPFRTRTRCDPHPGALWRRAAALAREHGLDFLGYYHSHPEEAHSRAHALSKEDREVFFRDRRARIEVVVSVDRAGKRARVPAENPCVNRDGSLSFWREGFYFRISAEAKEPARAGRPRSHAR